MLKTILQSVRRLFLPPVCVLCGSAGQGEREVCVRCLAALPWTGHACPRCALPVAGGSDMICGKCLRQPPAYDRCFSLFAYRYPVDLLIQRLKFNAKLNVASLLGELMSVALKQHFSELPQVIIPVPLHRSRLRERGFNQALEIARAIARRIDIPVDYRCCVRVRATSAQSSLPASARRSNVKDAFQLVRPLAARHVALVDDVMTTGQTIGAVTGVLRASGVEKIDVWLVARAARHS